ncbi:hypothetical protein BGW41_004310 [Actinomortierella wolfii]|nr:hypothetical protein BGW41_004310 [Actinomortierella wolfii]
MRLLLLFLLLLVGILPLSTRLKNEHPVFTDGLPISDNESDHSIKYNHQNSQYQSDNKKVSDGSTQNEIGVKESGTLPHQNGNEHNDDSQTTSWSGNCRGSLSSKQYDQLQSQSDRSWHTLAAQQRFISTLNFRHKASMDWGMRTRGKDPLHSDQYWVQVEDLQRQQYHQDTALRPEVNENAESDGNLSEFFYFTQTLDHFAAKTTRTPDNDYSNDDMDKRRSGSGSPAFPSSLSSSSSSPSSSPSPTSTTLFSQPSATQQTTFRQLYYVNDEHYRPGGPILLWVGGESPLHSMFLNRGLLYELAQETNGLLVALEHRFYGNSIPRFQDRVVKAGTEDMHRFSKPEDVNDNCGIDDNSMDTATEDTFMLRQNFDILYREGQPHGPFAGRISASNRAEAAEENEGLPLDLLQYLTVDQAIQDIISFVDGFPKLHSKYFAHIKKAVGTTNDDSQQQMPLPSPTASAREQDTSYTTSHHSQPHSQPTHDHSSSSSTSSSTSSSSPPALTPRWILAGCSYGGNLAVWARQKHPSKIFAAFASSAPLRSELDFFRYSTSQAEILGLECSRALSLARDFLDDVLATNNRFLRLMSMVNLTEVGLGDLSTDVDSRQRAKEHVLSWFSDDFAQDYARPGSEVHAAGWIWWTVASAVQYNTVIGPMVTSSNVCSTSNDSNASSRNDNGINGTATAPSSSSSCFTNSDTRSTSSSSTTVIDALCDTMNLGDMMLDFEKFFFPSKNYSNLSVEDRIFRNHPDPRVRYAKVLANWFKDQQFFTPTKARDLRASDLDPLSAQNLAGIAWLWQTCSEVGYLQTSRPSPCCCAMPRFGSASSHGSKDHSLQETRRRQRRLQVDESVDDSLGGQIHGDGDDDGNDDGDGSETVVIEEIEIEEETVENAPKEAQAEITVEEWSLLSTHSGRQYEFLYHEHYDPQTDVTTQLKEITDVCPNDEQPELCIGNVRHDKGFGNSGNKTYTHPPGSSPRIPYPADRTRGHRSTKGAECQPCRCEDSWGGLSTSPLSRYLTLETAWQECNLYFGEDRQRLIPPPKVPPPGPPTPQTQPPSRPTKTGGPTPEESGGPLPVLGCPTHPSDPTQSLRAVSMPARTHTTLDRGVTATITHPASQATHSSSDIICTPVTTASISASDLSSSKIPRLLHGYPDVEKNINRKFRGWDIVRGIFRQDSNDDGVHHTEPACSEQRGAQMINEQRRSTQQQQQQQHFGTRAKPLLRLYFTNGENDPWRDLTLAATEAQFVMYNLEQYPESQENFPKQPQQQQHQHQKQHPIMLRWQKGQVMQEPEQDADPVDNKAEDTPYSSEGERTKGSAAADGFLPGQPDDVNRSSARQEYLRRVYRSEVRIISGASHCQDILYESTDISSPEQLEVRRHVLDTFVRWLQVAEEYGLEDD